jgi:hypothetical protein
MKLFALWSFLAILFAMPVSLAAQDPRDRYPPDTVNVRRFPLRGQVAHLHPYLLQVDVNARSVSGGLDGAMTVPYMARGKDDYQRFKMSDWVIGEIIVSNNRLYVINLRVVTEAEVQETRRGRKPGS